MIRVTPSLLLVLLSVPASLPASDRDVIAVSATAVKVYVRATDPAGRPLSESYVLGEGHFFGGHTADRGLDRTTFADITKTLAGNLAKQNYFPAKSAEDASLLLLVHWGTTEIYEDPQRDFNVAAAQAAASAFSAAQSANGLADPTTLNFELNALATAQASVQGAINRNAVLLGYERNLMRERREWAPTTAEITMSNELNEERYFVIVLAYDRRTMTKEHKSKPLWITRLSIRSPGNNFTGALPVLSQAGSEVFGRQVDELIKVKVSDPRGTVTLRELEIRGVVPETPPAK